MSRARNNLIANADIKRAGRTGLLGSNSPVSNFDLDIGKYLVGGIAARAAARVTAQSGWDAVLVPRVVTDPVAGAPQNSFPR
jgi:hypothetical protein